MTRHPVQPLVYDEHGVLRFKKNAIVRFLLDNGNFDLGKLERLHFTDEDWEHFLQLIGYSVSGFGEWACVTEETLALASDQKPGRVGSNHDST